MHWLTLDREGQGLDGAQPSTASKQRSHPSDSAVSSQSSASYTEVEVQSFFLPPQHRLQRDVRAGNESASVGSLEHTCLLQFGRFRKVSIPVGRQRDSAREALRWREREHRSYSREARRKTFEGRRGGEMDSGDVASPQRRTPRRGETMETRARRLRR